MSSPTQHEWQEMEHAWVNRALVAERKLTALQASHEEMVKALKPCLGHLADYLDKCGTNKAQPTLDNAILALANAAKLAPTKADGKQAQS